MSIEEKVLKALAPRGVLKGRLLSAGGIARVRELEETRSRTPWGRSVNLGVAECLKRRYVLAALTSPSFKWPPGPYALIKVGDSVVGVVDEKGVRVDARALARAKGEHVLVILPLQLPELNRLVREPVAASPSPQTHMYLAELLGGGEGCGTLLVAFDGPARL